MLRFFTARPTLRRTSPGTPQGSSRVSPAQLGPAVYRLFVAATAMIGLHILVDAFVAVEPGVARSAHLVSAGVPIALLALVTSIYPRVRSGLRASAALVLGLWAMVGAGIAVVHARSLGPQGDDWTGFLLIPAGSALLGLGIVGLWRSRKQQGHPLLRRSLLTVAAVLIGYFFVWPVGIAILGTHKPRAAVQLGDLGGAAEAVSLRTSDGLALAATYVPAQNGAAVILYPRNFNPTEHARMLVRHGYGVLLVDMRGQGQSEGDPNAWGWGAAKDIDAAVAWLRARPDVDDARIGGLGLSVGGEQLIEAAAGNDQLRAIVVEGVGMRSAREGLARTGIARPQVWLQLVNDWVDTVARTVLSGQLPPPSLVDLAPQVTPRPILFLLGEHDNPLEQALTPAYYAAAGEPKTLWVIPGAGHTGGLAAQPTAYEQQVVGFFDAALLRIR